MKFGKQLQAEQIPGWTRYYLDYKFLKKIVGSLAKGRPAAEAAALAVGIQPADILGSASPAHRVQPPLPPLWSTSQVATPGVLASEQISMLPLQSTSNEDERGSAFQAHKAINSFYLQKEAELKLRLETLLSKRKAAASRFVPDGVDDTLATRDHVEWKAVEEGFRLLERDLGKLQKFVEINAIGFRKILKKWDKRSKSTTKELYLSRQVEVQPVFNRQLISELSDEVAACLMDLTNVSAEAALSGPAATDMIFSHQITLERTVHMGAFNDLESNLRNAVSFRDEPAVRDLVRHAENLSRQEGARTLLNRILWKAAIDAPPTLADVIMLSPATPFDFHFIDDINGRTCLHEASIAGEVRLVELCINKGVQVGRADVYGRSALHYAAMNGHAAVCRILLAAGVQPEGVDMDNYSPLTHSIISGNVECVEVLLADPRVSVNSGDEMSDPIPLSLACQFGRMDVALLLTQHGARSLPNSNGEFPMHLAAREGHAGVCRLLVNHEGCDVADKYNEWTPLFHAAANGHEECLEILLDAGCKAYNQDETGKSPVFYAAWNGHFRCVSRLLAAIARSPGTSNITRTRTPVSVSPLSDLDLAGDGDADRIPSLSLPPPIIPFRVYGHNYLDKTATLIQITLGHPFSTTGDSPDAASTVRLMPRIVGPSTLFPQSTPSLKLVMTSLPESCSAQHTVSLPLKSQDSAHAFAFQSRNFADFSLEVSIFPSFGSKTLGRAIALPAVFENIDARSPFVLPVLDHRLHVIGQISFEACIITPFRSVTLEIGGAIETYWKSTSVPSPEKASSGRRRRSGRLLANSTQTSPSVYSPSRSDGTSGITVSSLCGEYIHAVIQVTRDLVPVIFSRWNVPNDDELDIGVADLTLTQLRRIAVKSNIAFDATHLQPSTRAEWVGALSTRFLTLEDLLRTLPFEFGISLELAYPTPVLRGQYCLSRNHDLNSFVDSVLSAVYNTISSFQERRPTGGPEPLRRKLMFSSFAPDVCAALNWKQPNYAVFFASDCGIWGSPDQADITCSLQVDRTDKRCKSVAAAVEFVKANNLLGVLLNASILSKVPSLIQGIKDTGILLAAFCRRDVVALESSAALDIDATMNDGVLTFSDHTPRPSI